MASSHSARLLASAATDHDGEEDDRDTATLVKAGGAALAGAKLPKILFVYVLIAGFANVLFGYETSVIAQAKLDFAKDYTTTSDEIGFLTGGMAIGATVGVFFAGFLQDYLGRRRSLILSNLVYMGSVAVTCTSDSFAQLAAGRVLTGLAIGISSSTVPMFIAELSPPALRGSLVTVNQVCICTGILLAYAATKVLSPAWRIEFVAGAPLAFLLMLAFIFVTPYSPRWLMAKDREDEARAVLLRIRGGDEAAVEAELDGIRAALGAIRSANPYVKLKEPHVRWAIVIGVSCAIMQQWCGVNAVNGYAQDIFILAGASASQAATDAVYIGVAKLGFVIVALILMDRVGRKPLLLVGCAGMAASLLGLALTLRLAPTPIPASTGSIATATLILFMAFFEISLGPVLWLLLSELYPVQVKGIAMSAGSTTCWFFTYMVTQTFLPMKQSMGIDGVFFFFAAVCIFCFFWILRYVPETKGRTLEEIEELLRAEVSGSKSGGKTKGAVEMPDA